MTDKQIREFWEKCGFSQSKVQIRTNWWHSSDGRVMRLPPIDLNNLFKYAEKPVMLKVGAAGWLHILNKWVYQVAMQGADPAQTLKMAIEEAFNG